MDGERKIHVLDASWKVSLSARGRKLWLTSCHEWWHLILGELWIFIEIGEFNPTIFEHFLALFFWHPICIMLGGLWRNPIVYSPFCILFSASRSVLCTVESISFPATMNLSHPSESSRVRYEMRSMDRSASQSCFEWGEAECSSLILLWYREHCSHEHGSKCV